jgi:hypothetical protein
LIGVRSDNGVEEEYADELGETITGCCPAGRVGPAACIPALRCVCCHLVKDASPDLRRSASAVTKPIIDQPLEVKESDDTVDTQIDVQTNDRIVINATGRIWAGVAFTGDNGPGGWSWTAGNKFTLVNGHAYSLIGSLDGIWWEIGTGATRTYTGPGSRLYLAINDDVHGNGNGAFSVKIQVYREGRA